MEIRSLDILVTPRLTLRPPLMVDAEDIAEHLANRNVTRNLNAALPSPYRLEDAEAFVGRADSSGDETYMLVRERAIGCVGLRRQDDGRLRVGYWLGEPWWHRGLMEEGLGAVLARHPDERMCAEVFADNERSMALLERMGFSRAGQGRAFAPARNAEVETVVFCRDG